MVKAGVRYGADMRKITRKIKKNKTSRYSCPTCGKKSVKRKGYARWKCKSCGSEYAGGAYSFTTPGGESVKRMIVNVKRAASGKVKKVKLRTSKKVKRTKKDKQAMQGKVPEEAPEELEELEESSEELEEGSEE